MPVYGTSFMAPSCMKKPHSLDTVARALIEAMQQSHQGYSVAVILLEKELTSTQGRTTAQCLTAPRGAPDGRRKDSITQGRNASGANYAAVVAYKRRMDRSADEAVNSWH